MTWNINPPEDDADFRKRRIERLLKELRFEITRGMLENEIEEELGFRFYVPQSRAIPDGVVFCEFSTRPILRTQMCPGDLEPRLKVVE